MSRTTLARNLRKGMTDAERLLWRYLRLKQVEGSRFRRQHPLGQYIVDFVCLDRRLILELDGGQHLESKRDAQRDAWLAKEGYKVLRFWNNDVLKETEGVFETIRSELACTPSLTLPPPGGGKSVA